MPASIALFAYARPEHTRRTIDSLLQNPLARDSELFVFSDAPAKPEKSALVADVRAYLRTITGFRSVTIRERTTNYGLAKSIITGVTELLEGSGRVIVLEDDMVTSPHFLRYMNEALDLYADDANVASIHGYCLPIPSPLPETFFIRGADCWGWGTWQRAWKQFIPDGRRLLAELERRNLTRGFDFDDSYPFTQMLRDQIAGRNDSWAIRWYASAYLKDMITLHPGRSLVLNIGNDGSGIHCEESPSMDAPLSDRPISLQRLPCVENIRARKLMSDFFASLKAMNPVGRRQRLKRFFRRSARLIREAARKDALRRLTPPLVWNVLISARRSILHRGRPPTGIVFEGSFRTWEEAASRCGGYAEKAILDRVLQATLKVARGEAEFERDSVLFDHIEYAWPVLAGLMWAAARSNGKLSVLDYGGSLGTSFFQNRNFVRKLDVQWNVVEQPHYVAAGKSSIHERGLFFYETIDQCVRDGRPNVILLSGVLQYLPNAFALLSQLLDVHVGTFILDRTSYMNFPNQEVIKIQRVPESIYPASYPCRFFVEESVVAFVQSRGYRLIERFDSIEKLASFATWKGHIFASSTG